MGWPRMNKQQKPKMGTEKKKTIAIVVLAVFLVGSLGTLGSGPSQREYDSLVRQVESLQTEAEVRERELDTANTLQLGAVEQLAGLEEELAGLAEALDKQRAELEALQAELEEVKAERDTLAAENADLQASASPRSTGGTGAGSGGSGSAGTPAVTETPTPPETPAVTETPPIEETPVETISTMVWIPRTGSKYHSRASCSNMKNPSEVTLEEAESRGFGRCSKCW